MSDTTEPGPGDQAPDRYRDWDAAYLLGSLSAPDRAEYERHLGSCRRCSDAVAELAALPGLLGRVDPIDAASFADDPDLTERFGPPPDLVTSIRRADAADRRRRRVSIWAVAAAAAVIAAGAALVLPPVLDGGDRPAVVAELAGPTGIPLSADVSLYPEPWGTRIEMTCIYQRQGGGHRIAGDPDSWDYGLYVIRPDGTAAEVSTWTARAGTPVHTIGSTNVPVDAISSIQVRTVDTGTVLLSSPIR